MNKGIHASKRDNFSIFFVILNRRTGRTRSEGNDAGRKIYSALTVCALVHRRYLYYKKYPSEMQLLSFFLPEIRTDKNYGTHRCLCRKKQPQQAVRTRIACCGCIFFSTSVSADRPSRGLNARYRPHTAVSSDPTRTCRCGPHLRLRCLPRPPRPCNIPSHVSAPPCRRGNL